MDDRPTPPITSLEPVLSEDQIRREADGTPAHYWTSGEVARTFFDRQKTWMQSLAFWGKAGDDVLPPTTVVGGGRVGSRRWTLVDVERLAFHLHRTTKGYDAASLLRTLDALYGVARLHGMLRPDQDPIRQRGGTTEG